MEWYLPCPHCNGMILIKENEINCGIFRHAQWKDEKKGSFSPHSPKHICDSSVENNEIYGCGKPFKIQYSKKEITTSMNNQRQPRLIICEYI